MEAIECPIEWCTGHLLDHGGDGAGPEDWLHSDYGVELVHGVALYRSQVGSGPLEWEVVVGGATLAIGLDPANLARKLRDIAGGVESLNLEHRA